MPPVDVPQDVDDDVGDEGKELTDLPISPPMLSLFVKYHRALSVRERQEVCIQLAKQFAAEYDPTANDATEEWHTFFEQYLTAELALKQATVKLSRLAIHWMTEAVEKADMSLEDIAHGVEQASRAAN